MKMCADIFTCIGPYIIKKADEIAKTVHTKPIHKYIQRLTLHHSTEHII